MLRPSCAPAAEGATVFMGDIDAAQAKGLWPKSVARSSGSIVNLSLICGFVGQAGTAAYVATKHGMNGLNKSAALDMVRRC